jgi:hypothetical protein
MGNTMEYFHTESKIPTTEKKQQETQNLEVGEVGYDEEEEEQGNEGNGACDTHKTIP